ncbi:hypothetical protein OPT61_g9918 [Boeremia exigua]|uniref:Uncharacterized protein n=1 Tax=Boeremia exigua TaxID=749465 RepID=A0ACC2HS29_9PLEO|nr:hypothetical protein OPT61_g9918 [Boeremia exigua]
MDYLNNKWSTDFLFEEIENDRSVHYDHASPEEHKNTAMLNNDLHQAQIYGGWGPPWPSLSRAELHATQALPEAEIRAYDHTTHATAPRNQSASAAHAVPAQLEETLSYTTSAVHSINKPSDTEVICSVHCQTGTDRMKFHCLASGCHGSYGRWADFTRHYKGTHAVNKNAFWCPENECRRNKANGSHPFPRKDKLEDHLRQAHPGRV